MDDLRATGMPYDGSRPRWLTCHQGDRWCGWHRTSNGLESLQILMGERSAHEENCRGGLILL